MTTLDFVSILETAGGGSARLITTRNSNINSKPFVSYKSGKKRRW
jgi:hypothetical protein